MELSKEFEAGLQRYRRDKVCSLSAMLVVAAIGLLVSFRVIDFANNERLEGLFIMFLAGLSGFPIALLVPFRAIDIDNLVEQHRTELLYDHERYLALGGERLEIGWARLAEWYGEISPLQCWVTFIVFTILWMAVIACTALDYWPRVVTFLALIVIGALSAAQLGKEFSHGTKLKHC
jgi:hypothetical protein